MKHSFCPILISLLFLGQHATAAPEERVVVVGEARMTTEVPYTNDMTASKAIVAAGGWGEFSHKSVYLIRSAQVTELDMQAVLRGQRDKDIPLKPWDIIAVGDSVRQRR